ncbi:MAG: MoxR family ATPase [Caldilineaceae bacterium]
MKPTVSLGQKELSTFLLNVAIVRPVFIWGPPGIGKSSLVEKFAADVGLPCVSLLGSQLAPEDIIGVPQIVDGKSRFCPPAMIARDEPYCLFLDELNACSHEVQKSFYSLIHERRVGDYYLPTGSIVIGAGNRAQDSAIVTPMSSALLNRMVHVQLQARRRLAGMGVCRRSPCLGAPVHRNAPRPSVGAAAQDRRTVLIAPFLAHAQ